MSSFGYHFHTASVQSIGYPAVIGAAHRSRQGSVPYVKTIVCLANSQKARGRCIAGKEVLEGGKCGGWVRPVSARPKAEVLLSECRYLDCAVPALLDILDVPLLRAIPANPQKDG